MRSWTYEEVTAKTEKKIEKLMAEAKVYADIPERKQFHEIQAIGVYFFWFDLTIDEQSDADADRLQALTFQR